MYKKMILSAASLIVIFVVAVTIFSDGGPFSSSGNNSSSTDGGANATSSSATSTSTSTPSDASMGTLKGRVTLSPICPVERIPPDPACAPKGYQTTITVQRVNSTMPALTTKSDAQGTFSLNLSPGTYLVKAAGGTTLPRCEEAKTVTVQAQKITTADISCDTGIR